MELDQEEGRLGLCILIPTATLNAAASIHTGALRTRSNRHSVRAAGKRECGLSTTEKTTLSSPHFILDVRKPSLQRSIRSAQRAPSSQVESLTRTAFRSRVHVHNSGLSSSWRR